MSGVFLSLLAGVIAFVPFFALGNLLLDKTVYGEPFMGKMGRKHFSDLQTYVEDEQITEKNLHRLNAWCSRGDKVYLTIYLGDVLSYESHPGMEPWEQEEFEQEFEKPERKHTLVLADGRAATAFLYYYAGDAYYYWTVVVSGLLAFAVFSLCFITFVHRKLRYIQLLKRELDILAGGELSYNVSIKGKDELAELAFGIDQMRRSILAHQQAEEKMRSNNSQLVTAMSHDLRTPLTSLLAYLEMLEREKYDSPEQMRYFVSRSLEKSLRIKNMADKLFEYFLVYSSEWESPELETVDADQFFQQFWGEYAFSLESQGYSVGLQFEQLNGSIRVNTELLRRAFDNLYGNLMKYADSSSPILVYCCRDESKVILTIINVISKERSDRESTNIGLNTCRQILQQHGGSFEAEELNGQFHARLSLPIN